jgi:uncharacterized membrane protein HdeD (DUF308 family)
MAGGLFADSVLDGVQRIRSSWGWFLGLGILLIACGLICIAGDVTATFVTVFAFGVLMMISGMVALVHAFRVSTGSGFFLYLLSALLRGFTGYVLIRYPVAGAVGITLVLATFFIVGGLFRVVGAGTLRLPQWGWSVFSGVVSVVLGLMLLTQMPVSSLWFIGFAIGLDMILEGASLVGFAVAIHRLPRPISYRERNTYTDRDLDKAA